MSPNSAVAPRVTSSEVLVVERISTWDGMKQLTQSWTRLAHECAAEDFFMSWEFAGSWWQAYQAGCELFVLLCRNEHNDIVGIAPLYRESTGDRGLKSRTLRLIGGGTDDADGFGFLLHPGLESNCMRVIADWLAAQDSDWDVLRFASLTEGSHFAQVLLAEVESRGWVQRVETTPHLVVELPPTWEQYVGGLSAKVRQTWLRKMRHAEQRYELRLRRTESVADLEADLETAIQLHNKSWRARGMAGKLESPDRRKFYLSLAHAAFQAGSLDLWLLEIDGVPRAARLGFRAGNTRYAMLAGMDPDFAEFSPGTITEAMVLKQCIERGDSFYDFLAGDEDYKLECRPSQRRYLNLTIARPRTRAGVQLAAHTSVQEGKDWLRSEMPGAFRFLKKTSDSLRAGSAENVPSRTSSVTRASDLSIRLQVIREQSALQTLSSDWNSLLARSSVHSVFLTWEWMAAWLDAYGSRELLTLVGFAPSGEMVGVAPFYVSPWPKAGRRSLRILKLMGGSTGDAGSLGLISVKGDEEQFAESVAAWLTSNHGDYNAIELENLDGIANAAFLGAMQRRKWAVRRRASSHMVIDLPGSVEQFQQRLSRGFRKSLNSAGKNLSSRETEFKHCESESEVSAALHHLFHLHTRRWAKKGRGGAFAETARQVFYRRLAASMLTNGKLDLWTMTVDGHTVAAELGLIDGRTRASLQAGFDPDYSRFNVGSLLDQQIIAAAIQRGVRSYDLLEGEQEYKRRWGAVPMECVSIRCAPPRSMGAAWVRLSRVSAAQSLWRTIRRRSLSR